MYNYPHPDHVDVDLSLVPSRLADGVFFLCFPEFGYRIGLGVYLPSIDRTEFYRFKEDGTPDFDSVVKQSALVLNQFAGWEPVEVEGEGGEEEEEEEYDSVRDALDALLDLMEDALRRERKAALIAGAFGAGIHDHATQHRPGQWRSGPFGFLLY